MDRKELHYLNKTSAKRDQFPLISILLFQIYPALVLLVLHLYINPFSVDDIASKYVEDLAVNVTIVAVRVKSEIYGFIVFENP